jgi:hypothetical protein
MIKIVVHRLDSVSEYFLNIKNEILEKRYSSQNRDKEYFFKKEDPSYNNLMKLFDKHKKEIIPVKKERTINEYRQNKDVIYLR